MPNAKHKTDAQATSDNQTYENRSSACGTGAVPASPTYITALAVVATLSAESGSHKA